MTGREAARRRSEAIAGIIHDGDDVREQRKKKNGETKEKTAAGDSI